MNAYEVAQMLTYAKTLDQRLRIPEDRDERELMANAWAGLLAEVPFGTARAAIDRHYRHEKDTITASVILTHWRNQKSRDAYATNYGDGGRKCTVSACSCTHTECTHGWLDDDDIVIRNGRQYVTATRCPKCAEYLGEIKREREATKPW